MAVQVEFETRHIESVASHRIGQQTVGLTFSISMKEPITRGAVIVIETMANGRPSGPCPKAKSGGTGRSKVRIPALQADGNEQGSGARRSMGSP